MRQSVLIPGLYLLPGFIAGTRLLPEVYGTRSMALPLCPVNISIQLHSDSETSVRLTAEFKYRPGAYILLNLV